VLFVDEAVTAAARHGPEELLGVAERRTDV